jgi:hypothetical protein
MTRMFLDGNPGLVDVWAAQNPQNRIGRPDELRGVATWLASDASSYCTGSECVILPLLAVNSGLTKVVIVSSLTVATAPGKATPKLAIMLQVTFLLGGTEPDGNLDVTLSSKCILG